MPQSDSSMEDPKWGRKRGGVNYAEILAKGASA